MITQPATPKRWRPRFSVRTLVVLVTLVCVYFGSWAALKDIAVEDAKQEWIYGCCGWPRNIEAVETLFPYIIKDGRSQGWYYVWLFGLTLPLTTDGLLLVTIALVVVPGAPALYRRAVREINAPSP